MGRKLRSILGGVMMLAVCLTFMFSYNIDDADAVATSYYNGLLGQYFDTAEPSNLSYERLIRIDQFEGFNWMTDAPDDSIERDTFSVVWTGYIEVPSTGNYDFYTYSDDGVQLKINGETLINRWGLVNLEYTKSNHSMYLEQGIKYRLSLKYQEIPLNSTIFLFWKKEGEFKSMVPSTAFYACQKHYDEYQSPVRVNYLQANGEGLKGEYFNGAQTVVDENSDPDYMSPDGQ
ncbi:MAG: PA14 domain-containing protein, partial [Oscillospiraceae bacterium]